MQKIELNKNNIFYRINDILYQKYDNHKTLDIFLNDTDKNATGAKITIAKPDGASINRSIVVNKINEFLVNFLATDCDKLGKYEFTLVATKPNGETQFQKFLFTVSDYTENFLFKIDYNSSNIPEAIKKYVDNRLNNLILENY